MIIPKKVVVILALGLNGCALTAPEEPTPVVESPVTGEHPAICYVYSEHKRIMVPISCAEAEAIK